jgi:hypothetical protein
LELLERHTNCAAEAADTKRQLQAHRDALVRGCRARLAKASEGTDLRRLEGAVADAAPFGERVGDELSAARTRCRQLIEAKREALAAAQAAAKPAETEAVLAQHGDFASHAEVAPSYSALVAAQEALCAEVVAEAERATASGDIAAMDAALEDVDRRTCAQTRAALDALQTRRKDMVGEMRNQLQRMAAAGRDVSAMGRLLSEAAPFEAHVKGAVRGLLEARDALLAKKGREAKRLLASSDYAQVAAFLESAEAELKGGEAAPLLTSLAEALGRLRRHRSELIEEARGRLTALGEAEDPIAIAAALAAHEQYAGAEADGALTAARAAARARRLQLVAGVAQRMLDCANNNCVSAGEVISRSDVHGVLKMQRMLREHADFPNVDAARQLLSEAIASTLEQAQDAVVGALACADVDEVDTVLARFEPLAAVLGEPYKLLDAHLRRLW